MSIKKYVVGGVLTTAFAVYVFITNGNSSTPIVPESSTAAGSTSGTVTTNTTPAGDAPTPTSIVTSNSNGDDDGAGDGSNSRSGAVATKPTPTPAPTPTPVATTNAGQYKNGTYTGSVADAFYGNLQAVAIIKGGALVDITFPQYPANGHSGQISSQALPMLKQEAIAAQSANVNAISGATQISQAFDQSLASALAQAKS